MEYHSTKNAHSLKLEPGHFSSAALVLGAALVLCSSLSTSSRDRPRPRPRPRTHEPPRLLRLFTSSSSTSTPPRRASASLIRPRSSQADAYDTAEATHTCPPSHNNSNPYRPPISPLKHPDLLPTNLPSQRPRPHTATDSLLGATSSPSLPSASLTSSEASDAPPAGTRAQSNHPISIVRPDGQGNSAHTKVHLGLSCHCGLSHGETYGQAAKSWHARSECCSWSLDLDSVNIRPCFSPI